MIDQPTVTVDSTGAALLNWEPMGSYPGVSIAWTADEIRQLVKEGRLTRYSSYDKGKFRGSLIAYAVRNALIPQPAVYY